MAKAHKDKPPLTLDEHRALGAELYAINERLVALFGDLADRYPHRVAETASRAANGVAALRSLMEDVMFRETRGNDRNALLTVYYPAPHVDPAGQPEPPAVPKQP